MKHLGIALALLLLAPCVSSAEAGMTATDRSHIVPGSGQGGGTVLRGGLPQPSLPDYRERNTRTRVVLRRRASLASLGGPNGRLSRACREGQFRQSIDRHYVAVLDGRIYGAAIGGKRGLVDRLRLGNPGLVYIFVGQGTTSCRVFVGGTARG